MPAENALVDAALTSDHPLSTVLFATISRFTLTVTKLFDIFLQPVLFEKNVFFF
ncbi:hypothetical protein ACFPOD_01220 [Nitratireductor kimnyeongensis]|uniref:Uncharacterized protein n=1 Tax=Nitratireductor kimnyeongensis TaxID=430679 RepID=A0ABW0T347_9HYPH|nr:hypothetical protein [Nitratireductor kimnyeongensis]QZZ35239.1 hypothetical protein KW403_15980 [Nitratireductor kimnyeongensis]